MAKALKTQDSVSERRLHLALELSDKKWKLGFGDGERRRIRNIEAGNLVELSEEIRKSREHFRLPAECRVVSVYEAGRDGFWLHRALAGMGIKNVVVDSASIEVNRKQRRVKTDRVDAEALLRQLERYQRGEPKALTVVRVPTVEDEDRRRLHRERERLIQERGAHKVRIESLLVAQGIRRKLDKGLMAELDHLHSPAGYPLAADLKAEIRREYERYQQVHAQVLEIERTQKERVAAAEGQAMKQVARLLELRSVGWVTAWVLVMEFFGWREFRNRKELAACAGLTPTPYASGDMQRDQGISKAGNRRIRRLLVEIAWLWLRYQPNSALSQWYQQRFAGGGKRMRRVGIVALARKLLVALWRYVEHGELPAGATLSA
jgi:transposase